MGSLDDLVHTDPEAAWPLLIARAGEPDPELDTAAAIECLIDRHGERFVDRIEARARSDMAFAALFAGAYFGGGASDPVLERLWRLQDELIARGDLEITRIQGWFPIGAAEMDDHAGG